MVKFMFLGDTETGKTAIVSRFASGTFESSYNPTVDVDFSQTNVMVGEQRRRVALWQVAEKKGGIASNTFRGLHGAFIVADITRPDTFQSVSKFRQIIDEKLSEVGMAGVPVALLANKSDRLNEEGVSLSKASMEKLCKKHRLSGWYATSAKDNTNIDLAIKEVLRQALKGGSKTDFQDVAVADLEALTVETEQLNQNAQIPEREQTPGQPVQKDHQWFGNQNVAKTQGCACVIS